MFNWGCECIPKDSKDPVTDTVKIAVPPPAAEPAEEGPPDAGVLELKPRPPEFLEWDRQRERERLERLEDARLAKEQARKALVGAFLKEHGYGGVGLPRRTMTKTKYPIHTAAKIGDPGLIAALIEEGADPAQ
eukprot:CAMPEP_0179251820 /NCGR_PEP_ID=MMETSP0797-20121207/21887_1 /TAXON_ID=47934 /ORGANISM="Dinophysis acuminata, Strain DAEP01" /LENGTH=132 /DNA_ID=CAMNT_0020959613 /DNA_START=70 /DNA_END=465 /DNA_ORIENTATION=+